MDCMFSATAAGQQQGCWFHKGTNKFILQDVPDRPSIRQSVRPATRPPSNMVFDRPVYYHVASSRVIDLWIYYHHPTSNMVQDLGVCHQVATICSMDPCSGRAGAG